ncbi:MAG: hypothetical protein EOQ42_04465 [Mesorhizobium sp.]|nr:MAG: hypothetical protein EOQ43_09500 [Mesorhizobium sp.]RWB80441.1 MAG: hypothetical protein EOQ42_04465 [Mesorhizobium sp.]RWF78310.1 MAG: hypothetical protein EOS26_05695 [Mesorhizobium sp.]TIS68578.1 MAG: hypothetical protein E5W92_05125 [Mesorhizobium sp.]
MKRTSSALPYSLPPLGINREQAAAVIGVSPTTFDQMVSDGRMPQPRMPSKERYVWDVEELSEAFRRLPHRDGRLDVESRNANPWDRG